MKHLTFNEIMMYIKGDCVKEEGFALLRKVALHASECERCQRIIDALSDIYEKLEKLDKQSVFEEAMTDFWRTLPQEDEEEAETEEDRQAAQLYEYLTIREPKKKARKPSGHDIKNQKYVFISYSQQDKAKAEVIADILADMNVTSVYESVSESISENTGEIKAEAIKNSKSFIGLISENSKASSNFRKDTSFALESRIPYYGLYTEIPKFDANIRYQMSYTDNRFAGTVNKENSVLRKFLEEIKEKMENEDPDDFEFDAAWE